MLGSPVRCKQSSLFGKFVSYRGKNGFANGATNKAYFVKTLTLSSNPFLTSDNSLEFIIFFPKRKLKAISEDFVVNAIKLFFLVTKGETK
jgi:hypothetical protein